MKITGIGIIILLLLVALILPFSYASAATDGFYNLSEATPSWDGTDANRTKAPNADYDYTYGDEESVTYMLPWAFTFYGQPYSAITADTNGNIWFTSTTSIHSFDLSATGRGPVIAAWNNDLSSYFYGGVFIQHKTNPERVVIEWQTETYSEEGFFKTNTFETVLYQDGAIIIDYNAFNSDGSQDFGSGISRGNGINSINLSSAYGNNKVSSLAGHSFRISESESVAVVVNPVSSPANSSSQTIGGVLRGTGIAVAVDTSAQVGSVSYPTPTTWSCTLTDLPEGTNNITVTASDSLGNQATSTLSVLIDTIPPVVQIISPVGQVNKIPLLNFLVSDGIVTVKLDGLVIKGKSGEQLPPQTAGEHLLRVESRDTAGNVGFAETVFTVDETLPYVTINSPKAGLSYYNPVSLAYSVKGNSEVVKVDGRVFATNLGTPVDGSYTVSTSIGDVLTDGLHVIRVEASDTLGRTGYAEVSFTVVSPPTVTIESPVAQSYQGNPLLKFSTNRGTSVVKVDGLIVNKTSGSYLDMLPEGTHTVRVEATDSYGTGYAEVTFTITTPLSVVKLPAIATGYAHNIELKPDGTLWTWGMNDYGQLGDGTTTKHNIPVQIIADAGWIAVAAGDFHSIALKEDGTLWTWGRNIYGEVGNGSTQMQLSPVLIGSSNDKWIAVGAGSSSSYAIKKDGTLWAWGNNSYGVLGDGTQINRNMPVQVGTDNDWAMVSGGSGKTIAIKRSGTLWEWGNTYTVPMQISVEADWKDISVGYLHRIALKNDGSLWTWGNGSLGQLGDGTMSRDLPVQIASGQYWTAISAGAEHCLALRSDGTLWSWGYNNVGQLGDGTTLSKYAPVQIGSESDWVAIAGGGYYSAAIKSDRSIWAWGSNIYGQLGLGNTINRSSPQKLELHGKGVYVIDGVTYTTSQKITLKIDTFDEHGVSEMLFSNDGIDWTVAEPYSTRKVWTLSPGDGLKTVYVKLKDISGNWSDSYGYSLTLKTTPVVTANLPAPGAAINSDPVLIFDAPGSTVVVKVDDVVVPFVSGDRLVGLSDGSHTVSLVVTDSLGNMSVSETTFIVDKIPPLLVSPVVKSASTYHTVAILADGSLWAWGGNWSGQVGDGTNVDIAFPVRIGSDVDWADVVTGGKHTVALKQDGSLWAWGANSSGQLGDGSGIDKSVPIRIGTDNDWATLTAGYGHTIALKKDGSLWAWGSNWSGQLGNGTNNDQLSPVQIGTDIDWKAISTTEEHTLALKTNGSLWAWGNNGDGQLGDGTNVNQLSPVRIGFDNDWKLITVGYSLSLALKQDGSLWAWGVNWNGQLGDGTTINKGVPQQVGGDVDWKAVQAGLTYVLALKNDNSMWSWGDNYYGQLGNGKNDNILSPIKTNITNVRSIGIIKDSTSIVLKSDGSLWGWGYNGDGELGLGATDNKLSPYPIPLSNGFGLQINNGASITSSASVVLGYIAVDLSDVSEMQFSNDNATWTTPEPYAPTKNWTLGQGIGPQTVYARFKDNAGNWSDVYSASIELQALPTGIMLTVAKTGTGTGNITSTPLGIDCGAICSNEFSNGNTVTLTATPDNGSTFTGWSGACTGTGPCTVTMDAAKTVTATFNLGNPRLSIVFAGTGQGAVTSSPSGISCNTNCSASFSSGTQVTLMPLASEYNVFGGWSNGVCNGIDNCSLTINSDASLTVTFDKNLAHQFKINNSYYSTAQDAYNAAVDGDVIKLWAVNINENLVCNRSVAVTLQGGYDANYLNITGETILTGTLTVIDGSVSVDGLTIK